MCALIAGVIIKTCWDELRWKPPVAQADMPSSDEILKALKDLRPWLRQRRNHAWAAAYNMIWNKFIDESVTSSMVALAVGVKMPDNAAKTFSYHVVTEKVRHERYLASCALEGRTLTINSPTQISSVFDLLCPLYDPVRNGAYVILFSIQLDKWGDRATGDVSSGITSTKFSKVCVLKKPSKRLAAQLKAAESGSEPESAVQNADSKKQAEAEAAAADADGSARADDDEGEGDVGDHDIIQGLVALAQSGEEATEDPLDPDVVVAGSTDSTGSTSGHAHVSESGDLGINSSVLRAVLEANLLFDADDDDDDDQNAREEFQKFTGEELVQSHERKLVKEALELGFAPSEAAIRAAQEGGLDEVDSLHDAVLSDRRCLGPCNTLKLKSSESFAAGADDAGASNRNQ
jgi:hypothetical protein